MKHDLDLLASECVLKQANAKWGSADILRDYLEKAYRLGKAQALAPKLNEEGGS